jgi:hypothetical protein
MKYGDTMAEKIHTLIEEARPSQPSKFENGHHRSRAKPDTLYIHE